MANLDGSGLSEVWVRAAQLVKRFTGAVNLTKGDLQTQVDTKITGTAISSSSAITTQGEYALDAREKNASVEGTLANQISTLNSNFDIEIITCETRNTTANNSKVYKCGKCVILLIDIITSNDTFGSEAIFLYGLPKPAYNIWSTITTRDASVIALATIDIYANLKIFSPQNNVRYTGSIVYFTND